MLGGYQPIQVTDKQNLLVNERIDQINQKLSLCVEFWTVNSAWSQVVAGTNYYFHITADSGDYATVTFFQPLPGNSNGYTRLENAEYGHIAYDEERPQIIIPENFIAIKVDNEIRELVRSFRRQINDSVNHTAAVWIVNTVWREIKAGTNYLIQCTSNRGVFVTVKINVPGSWTKESPKISWSGQGHRSWKNYNQPQMPGGLIYGDVKSKDRRQVSLQFNNICKQSGVNAGSWTVNEVKSQVVSGKNYQFTLTSDCGVTIIALFYYIQDNQAQFVKVKSE